MRVPGRERYNLFFFDPSRAWRNALIVTLLLLAGGLAVFLFYNRISTDIAPDSLSGYSYAIAGTVCMVLATLLYTFTRHSRKRGVGQLNGALHWHVSLGILALFFLFLHCVGNFNLRSGTYALYGMLALVVSGFIGRGLDRLMPRLIAKSAKRALTEQGEDRIEVIEQTIQSIVSYNNQDLRSLAPQPAQAGGANRARTAVGNGQPAWAQQSLSLPTSWDLAYISLEETPQELERNEKHYRFVPDRKSALARPGALMPGLQENLAELQQVQHVLQREQFYRSIIRSWRVFHVALVLLTFALTLWHLEFAATLLIPLIGR